MSVIHLYNGIYQTLSNDEIVLNYLGIGTEASLLEKAKHIQKRAEPTGLAENMPIVTFYTLPGRRETGNLAVYKTSFVFDVYTNDDVPTAHNIAQRIIELFEDKIIPFDEVTSFKSLFLTAGEGETDLDNTYCFSVVIGFSIAIEKHIN